MSYWVASDKIPVQQKSVSIPAENGTNYIAGQEIRIRIDPSLKLFNPLGTFLQANVKIIPPATIQSNPLAQVGATPTKLQLDGETGFQSLCRSIRIHDNSGVLLEEIDSYNTMVAMVYDYKTNDSLRNKRALTEGSTAYDSSARGTEGSTKSVVNTNKNNPYSENQAGTTLNASWTATNYVDCKVTIPLHTGIMSNSRAFPNGLCGGITITILLEDNNRVFRQMDGAMRYRRLTLNPQFLGTTNSATASVVTNGSFNELFLVQSNSQHGEPQSCPFVVGERLGFQRYFGNSNASASLVAFNSASGVPVIKTIEQSAGYTKVTLNSSVLIVGKGMDSAADPIFAYSNSVNEAPSYDPTYLVSDVNLIVQEVTSEGYEKDMMQRMKEGGSIRYDFLSTTCYKYSQLASDRVANIRIPIQNKFCKSILAIPTDATVYTSKQQLNASTTYEIKHTVGRLNPDFYLRSNRSGLEGISDYISNYQFLYDGRLQPSRQVPLTKVATGDSIDAQHLIELDKALSQADIKGHSLQRFNQNFIIGRALALGDSVYDGRNKDFSLQVNYNEVTPPTKNKLWCMYVYHIRSLIINGNSVVVDV